MRVTCGSIIQKHIFLLTVDLFVTVLVQTGFSVFQLCIIIDWFLRFSAMQQYRLVSPCFSYVVVQTGFSVFQLCSSIDWFLCVSVMQQYRLVSLYFSYVLVAYESLKIVLKNFGPLIKANLTAPPSPGIDLSREDRYSIVYMFTVHH